MNKTKTGNATINGDRFVGMRVTVPANDSGFGAYVICEVFPETARYERNAARFFPSGRGSFHRSIVALDR